MTEIDLPSFLQSLHFAAAVGWDHSLSHSLAGSGLTLTHYGLSSSLPQSCNRVRPRPPRNELNRKTESEGEGLRECGTAGGPERSEEQEQEQHWIGRTGCGGARAPRQQAAAAATAGRGRPAGARPRGPVAGRGKDTPDDRTPDWSSSSGAAATGQDTQDGGARHKTRRRDDGGNESETGSSGTECET